MTGFTELCRKVRFSDDTPGPPSSSSEEHLIAEYAARMRSQALLVTETLTPGIHRAVANVAEQLSLDTIPSCFVVCDPQVNASAPLFGSHHEPIVILNSGLVELLSAAELQFVIGHELGHLGCGHGAAVAQEAPSSEYEALHRRAESRAKEISADRIGLIGVRSLTTAANVMVKLASGLSFEHLRLDIGTFLEQLRRDPAEVSREWELHHTHPSLPFRLLSMVKFSETSEYLRISGTGGAGRPLAEVDEEIVAQMEQMGDGRLPEMQRERFDRTVAWAGAALFMDDGVIQRNEREALHRLIGEELADKVLSFAEQHSVAELEKKLQQSLEQLNSMGERPIHRFVATYRSLVDSLGLNAEQTRPWNTITRALPETESA